MSHKTAKRERQANRDRARRWLVRALELLQAEFRKRSREHYERFPNAGRPCHTCAVNPQTNDWRGQDSTALRLIGALMRSDPFYCHDGAPFDEEHGWAVDPKTAPLCAGFMVLMDVDVDATKRMIRDAVTTAYTECYGDRMLDDDEAFNTVCAQLIEAVA